MHPAQVALHIGLLVASGALDAHSTRDLRARSIRDCMMDQRIANHLINV